MSDSKPSVDRESLSDAQREILENSKNENIIGLNGTWAPEDIVTFDRADRETVIQNSDSYIVLGGDRICSKGDGYGGKAHTGAHMIDLVVGRDKDLLGNPSFVSDSARIYVSQKSDLDRAFGLTDGVQGNSKARSCVVAKADHVRLIARRGIKLVTMGKGESNSHGIPANTYMGIELIAGNDSKDMQPIARAKSVSKAFHSLMESIEELTSLVENFLKAQNSFNRALMFHTHIGPGFGSPTTPSIECGIAGSQAQITIMSLAELPMRLHRINCQFFKINYLQPFGDEYIGSDYNYTN